MSLSPSLPPGAPSLADVLIQRTFAKPPHPFVDGEFIEALSHADDDRPSVTAAAAASARAVVEAANAKGTPGPESGATGTEQHANTPSPAPAPGSKIDLRA
jgi:hypothetical protein